MAKRSDDVDLTPHLLVKKLASDFNKPRQGIELIGYLGPSKADGSVRLYTDLTFHTYFEIPTNGIVHHHYSDDPGQEAKPTHLVIEATTKIEFVQFMEASFLQGKILSCFSIQACCASLCRNTTVTGTCPCHTPCTRHDG